MSTRAVIGRKTDKGFTGVYHHWDGYPSGLGAALFRLRASQFSGDTAVLLKHLIDAHPGGWSTINDTADGTPLAECKCYCKAHGGDSDSKGPGVNEHNASGCGCEWAYVFDGNGKMEVQVSICGPGRFEGQKMVGAFGCGDPKGTWKTIATVDLNGPEPDWAKIEA